MKTHMLDKDIFAPAPRLLGERGEAMVTWFMEKEGTDRYTAIAWLVTFAEGNGHPSEELLAEFPELAELHGSGKSGGESDAT